MSEGHSKTFDKEKISFNLARLKTNGEMLEIVINPDEAVEFKTAVESRENEDIPEVGEPSISEIVKSEHVFHDASKGELASEHFLQEVFGTIDFLKVAEQILLRGEIQLTAEHRKRIRDAKLKKIINIIHRNAIDPTTNLPHPVARIETAMENIHFNLDEYRSAEDLVEEVMHKLRPILPIKFEVKQIEIKVFQEYAHKVYGDLRKNKVLHESWNTDGTLSMTFEIPAGIKIEFIDKLNSMTHGNVEIEVKDE